METIDVEQILASDLSEGTEWFRERLLQRCLSVLDQAGEQGVELDDSEIDMLAAAGVYNLAPDEDQPLS